MQIGQCVKTIDGKEAVVDEAILPARMEVMPTLHRPWRVRFKDGGMDTYLAYQLIPIEEPRKPKCGHAGRCWSYNNRACLTPLQYVCFVNPDSYAERLQWAADEVKCSLPKCHYSGHKDVAGLSCAKDHCSYRLTEAPPNPAPPSREDIYAAVSTEPLYICEKAEECIRTFGKTECDIHCKPHEQHPGCHVTCGVMGVKCIPVKEDGGGQWFVVARPTYLLSESSARKLAQDTGSQAFRWRVD
jgi:hypothetical protein